HNLSFTNMFMWRGKYKLNVHIEDDFIIIFSNLDEEKFSLNPICVIENVDQAIEYLLKYFKDNNIPFRMYNVVQKVKFHIEEVYGDFFTYELDRDSFDYLYSVDKILTYSGKKLQKKRNHVNNFKKTYENRYEIKLIEGNPDVVEDCIAFTKAWDESKVEDRDEFIDQEVYGTIDALSHFDQLSCEGLAIYIDGKLEAFSYGTQLNDTTAVLNVEKANPEIIGLYPFIRQTLVTTFFDDLKYINSEDDVGDERLRKSKLSYRPEYLVEKYMITRTDEN
ncbi:MAG: phosphatidylglycerol lysyltransferase domain-containing protein, partial [Coprobacillus sp.]